MLGTMNFRKKLLLTIIPIAILSIGVLIVISYIMASDGILTREYAMMKRLVQTTNNELKTWLNDRERDAVLFSENGLFQAASQGKRLEEAQEQLIKYHELSPSYENVFLADVNGKVFMDSIGGKSVGFEMVKIPGYKINVEKAEQGEVWTGNAMKSPATGRPVCLVTAPIKVRDQLVGIMGLPIELNVFSDEFISTVKIGKTGYMYLLDSAGNVLAHPDKKYILKTNLNDFEFGKNMLALKNGTLNYTWEGDDKIAEVATYDKKGWLMAATATRHEFLGAVRTIRSISLIVGLAAILLIASITWLVTGKVFKVLTRVVTELREVSKQVASAGSHVSSAGQMLAEGASEQAASVEETSSSLEEMASMTKQNADHANQADLLMKDSGKMVMQANGAMEELTVSMEDISKASEETSKIIKTIDEIAFQTNLLALNAAVEAARAGEAGAGFAVVADEVRNLALRAAEAAKNTASMIEGTVKKVKGGSELVNKANGAFVDVSESASKVGKLVAEIAAASNEQAQGIDQISKAVAEMDKITQQNAANAEESASASEEMDAQAEQMRSNVTELSALIGGSKRKTPKRQPETSAKKRVIGHTAETHKDPIKISKGKAMTPRATKEISPEDVIPMDEGDFKDF